MSIYKNLTEVARELGQHYDRVRYACLVGTIKPRTIGRVRLFTPSQVEYLRQHFADKDKKQVEVKP